MKYSTIKALDIANGPGIRVSLWVSGCRNRCKGCFNPETWDFDYGQEFTGKTLMELMDMLRNPHIKGLSILGGDPFEDENIKTVTDICKIMKANMPDKDIWVWTGYDFIEDGLIKYPIMQYIDVLVDGRFEEDKKDLRLHYRGSWNQRVINVSESIINNCSMRLEGDWR